MNDIEVIRDYFKKLQRVINLQASFSFFGKNLIQKSKIDDILCCIFAKLPESYKKIMRSSENSRYDSIKYYNALFDIMKKKFTLNPNVYIVDKNKANKLISTILTTIEFDIKNIESNAQ